EDRRGPGLRDDSRGARSNGRSGPPGRALGRTGPALRPGRARSRAPGRRAGGSGARPRLNRPLRIVFRIAAAAAGFCLAACASRPPSPPAVTPRPVAGVREKGIASWYGGNDGFEGKPTASGEIYD